MIKNQLISFGIYLIIGCLLGFIFDFFRAIRKSIKNSNIATYIEDIIYVIISFMIIVSALQILNDGELRFYIFLGIFIGVILYFIFISKYVIKIESWIISNIVKLFKKILFFIKNCFNEIVKKRRILKKNVEKYK